MHSRLARLKFARAGEMTRRFWRSADKFVEERCDTRGSKSRSRRLSSDEGARSVNSRPEEHIGSGAGRFLRQLLILDNRMHPRRGSMPTYPANCRFVVPLETGSNYSFETTSRWRDCTRRPPSSAPDFTIRETFR